jgi:rare lipoprotein A
VDVGLGADRAAASPSCAVVLILQESNEKAGGLPFNLPATILLASVVKTGAAGSTPNARSAESAVPQGAEAWRQATGQARLQPDLLGRKRAGQASFYAKRFAGRQMADGTKMKPQGNNAASKTLLLGTTATVTNIETGQCAVVTIQDRGPYVKGRIVDLSPHTALKIGITRDSGLAKVQVAPIAVPLPDGSRKPGVAAHDAKPDKRICGDRASNDAGSLREHSALRRPTRPRSDKRSRLQKSWMRG